MTPVTVRAVIPLAFGPVEFIVVLALLVVALALLSAPLRNAGAAQRQEEHEVERLEAAREAKYREIRDTEMDFRTGKLSEADFRELDRGLRAEAIEILRALDEARADGRQAR